MLILIVAVIIGTYGFVIDLADEYNTTINSSYKETYDMIAELQTNTEEIEGEVYNITPEKDKQFLTGTWDAYRVATEYTGDSINISKQLLIDSTEDLGLGGSKGFVYKTIVTIISILMVSALIFLIIRRTW
jgi:hypothetical protein